MNDLPRSLVLCVTVLALGFVAGCDSKKSSGTPGATPPAKVSVRLQWFPVAQFAGIYSAQAKGFYAQAGLDVTANPGGPDFNAITLVSNGSDTFGIWTADQILINSSKGVPIKIVAVIYRRDPNVLLVRKGSAIKSPKDFVGKRVTTVYGRATETVLRALLKKSGVDPKDVLIEPFPFNLQSFAADKVDVSAAYVYDHPYQARQLGMEVDIIDPGTYGISFYSDCLFVRSDMIDSDPHSVEAFVHATLRGWEFALSHKDEAVAIVCRQASGLNQESQAYMLEHSEPLIRAEDPGHLGLASEASLEAMKAILVEQGQLDSSFDVKRCFTNRFVESYYSQTPK